MCDALRQARFAEALDASEPTLPLALESIVGLDGPVQLMADGSEVNAECIMVPPMKRHAIMDYGGRIGRVYLDTSYRRLTYWKPHSISVFPTDAILRDSIEDLCSQPRHG